MTLRTYIKKLEKIIQSDIDIELIDKHSYTLEYMDKNCMLDYLPKHILNARILEVEKLYLSNGYGVMGIQVDLCHEKEIYNNDNCKHKINLMSKLELLNNNWYKLDKKEIKNENTKK